jgi:hypothetical protein
MSGVLSVEPAMLSQRTLSAADYEELDRLSRQSAAGWAYAGPVEARLSHEGIALADLLYWRLSLFFFWVYRQAALLDGWLAENKPQSVTCFRCEPGYSWARLSPVESILGPLLRAFSSKYGFSVDEKAPPRQSGKVGAAESFRAQSINGIRSFFYGAHRAIVRTNASAGPRVLVSGSSAVVGSVAEALGRRALLFKPYFDRPSAALFLKKGVPTVVLDPSAAQLRGSALEGNGAGYGRWSFPFRGVDLGPAVGPALDWILADRFPKLAARLDALREMMKQEGVGSVVVDEDVTESNKTLVAAAKSLGIPTAVCQHGLLGDRDGFCPLTADEFLAWGPQSAQRLKGWGMDEAKIRVVGAPRYDRLFAAGRRLGAAQRKKILLILAQIKSAQNPGRANSDHLMPAYLERMMQSFFKALSAAGAYEVVVKPHPRERRPEFIRQLLDRYAEGVRVSLAPATMPAEACLDKCDLVVGMESTSMLEAFLAGLPSICLNFSGREFVYDLVKDGISLGAYSPEELSGALELASSDEYRKESEQKWEEKASYYFSHPGGASLGVAQHLLERMRREHR